MRSDDVVPREGVVIEWVPFRTRAGVDEATLLAASDSIQHEFLERQAGFLRRELLRGADGEWVDLLYWTDEPSATAAMDAAGSSPICHAYFHLMEGSDSADFGADVRHLHRVRAYDASGVS